jgi:hypothetical protein
MLWHPLKGQCQEETPSLLQKNSLLHYTTMMIPPDFVSAPVFSFCFLVAKQLYYLTASHQAPIRIKA